MKSSIRTDKAFKTSKFEVRAYLPRQHEHLSKNVQCNSRGGFAFSHELLINNLKY